MRTGPEDFEGVGDVDETVTVAGSGGPAFDFGPFDLDGAAALAAYEVVMVFVAGAATVARFAVVASEGVNLARFGQGPHLVVDGGKGDVVALGLEFGVEVLRGAEAVRGVQYGGEGAFLPRGTLLGRATGQTIRTGSHHGLIGVTLLVVVPVAFVKGVAVPVVYVVDVVVMRDTDVSAPLAVVVVVAGMFGVGVSGALVEVPVVGGVEVPVMGIVDMVAVGDGDVAAAVAVYVGVVGVLLVGGSHGCSSWECRMASLTM